MITLRLGEGTGTLRIGSARVDLDVHERLLGSDCIEKIMKHMCIRLTGKRLRQVDLSGGVIVPLADIEMLYLENVLENRNGYSYNEIADRLGITARTLRTKRHELGYPVRTRHNRYKEN